MILVRSRSSGFTGSVTESRIALNDDGSLLRADPSEDSTPKPISKTRLEGSTLHITVTGGFEFVVNLKDSTHAEIRPVGAPPNMKPIPLRKLTDGTLIGLLWQLRWSDRKAHYFSVLISAVTGEVKSA